MNSAPEEKEEGRLGIALLGLLEQEVGSFHTCSDLASIQGKKWPHNSMIPQQSETVTRE